MNSRTKKAVYINQKFNEAKTKHNIEVFDNGGKTFDRFTVRIDKDVFGMSDDPLGVQGFNQYCDEARQFTFFGLGPKRKYIPIEIKKAILDRLEPQCD